MSDNGEKLGSRKSENNGTKGNGLETQVNACEYDVSHTLDITTTAKLLEDLGNGDLAKTLNIFRTPNGLLIYAATDAGFQKKENHDRVVINPNEYRFSILDGEGSARASHILANALLNFPDDLDNALKKAQTLLQKSGIHNATCLITAKLTPNNRLNVSQFGDCGALIFDREGTIKFSAKNQVKFRYDTLNVDMEFLGVTRTSQKLVDTSSVTTFSGISRSAYHYDEIQLSEGDTVILFSDFLWSNFSIKELSRMVKETKEPLDLFKKIAELSKLKMQSADLTINKYDFISYENKCKLYYSGDYVPHVDNQSLLIFKI